MEGRRRRRRPGDHPAPGPRSGPRPGRAARHGDPDGDDFDAGAGPVRADAGRQPATRLRPGGEELERNECAFLGLLERRKPMRLSCVAPALLTLAVALPATAADLAK